MKHTDRRQIQTIFAPVSYTHLDVYKRQGRYIPPALQPVPLTPEEQEELRKKEERKRKEVVSCLAH